MMGYLFCYWIPWKYDLCHLLDSFFCARESLKYLFIQLHPLFFMVVKWELFLYDVFLALYILALWRDLYNLSNISRLGIIYLYLGNREIQKGYSGCTREDIKWAGKYCYDYNLSLSLSLSLPPPPYPVLSSVQSLILLEFLYYDQCW